MSFIGQRERERERDRFGCSRRLQELARHALVEEGASERMLDKVEAMSG